MLVIGGGITGVGCRPRRRQPGPAHRPGRARRLRLRHLVEELEARARRPALPAAGRGPPGLRGAPRAPAAAPQRPAPRPGAAVPDPDPHQGRRDLAEDRPGARLGDVDVRPHRRVAHRQAPPAAEGRGGGLRPPADHAAQTVWPAPTCTTTPRPTTPGCASPSPAPPPRTVRWSPTGCRVVGDRPRTSGRGDGADGRCRRTTDRRPRQGRRQRRRRLGRRRARARRGRRTPDSIRPAKGVHITVPWDKVRNDIAVVIPVPKDKRSLFVVPWGPTPTARSEHTYVGTTDTDYDGPLDDPQCTARRHRLRARGAQRVDHRPAITGDDITGTWAGLRPLVNVAPVASGPQTADLSRRHQIVDERRAAWSPSPAAS